MPPTRPKSAFNRAVRKTLLVGLLAGTALTGTLIYMSSSDAKIPDLPDNVRPLDFTLLKHVPTYKTRAQDQKELDRLCDLPGKKPVGQQWAGMSRLQAYGGGFTRGLLSYANAASIYTCYYENPAVASTFDGAAGIARINKTNSLADMMLQDVHGIIHGYQRNEGKLAYNQNWNLYSRIMQKAASEAVAYAGEFVAAVELHNNGSDDLMNALAKNDPEGWNVFATVYNISKDPQEAASVAVNSLLRNRHFVAYHADEAIDSYFADLQAGKISANAANQFGLRELREMGKVNGFSLATNATLQTEQELRQIAPELSRTMDVLSAHNPDMAGKITQKRNGTGYTVRQAITRIDSEQSGKYSYGNRANIGGVFQNCAQADYKYAQVPNVTKDLWQNMQTIKQGPLMGAAIYDFSNNANIFHCYFKMSNDNAGEWYDDDGLVRISDRGQSPMANVLTSQAHEIIHGIQRTNNVRNTDPSWSIHEYQMMRLAHEAAGRSGQYVLALELKDVGIAGPWNDAKARYGAPALAAEAAYTRTKTTRLSPAAALTAAGNAGWYAQFSERGWADSYNNPILHTFINMVVTGEAKAQTGKTYPIETARMTGWMSNDLNFTSDLTTLPAFKDRFGGNEQMRQAFEYVNLEHIAYTTGRASPQYTQELQRLRTEKNPYLGVDLRVIASTLSSPDTKLTPLGAMNCFGGVSTGCTYGGKSLNPAQHKIKMQP
ncbi:MAG: DUF6782 family putative metallopeptidase [Alphaproteobacteria bacterium]